MTKNGYGHMHTLTNRQKTVYAYPVCGAGLQKASSKGKPEMEWINEQTDKKTENLSFQLL